MKRRTFIVSSIAAAIAAIVVAKPSRFGEAYEEYFATINEALKKGQSKPSMLIDLDRLDQNIQTLKGLLNDKAKYRVVVKSLPSLDLLKYITERAQTNRLMVFHQPFLNLIAEQMPNADVLIGKPMPIAAARYFYRTYDANGAFKPDQQLQWLIDSPQRLEQYLQASKDLSLQMQINIEVDVGLHRGGISTEAELATMLDMIAANPSFLSFSGFMGYDPQLVKIPSIIKSRDDGYKESQAIYQALIDQARAHPSNIDIESLCLNGAGSPTLELHKKQTVCNDLSAGSCLVKPTDFDIDTLTDVLPAAYIATPVLKKLQGTKLPGLEGLSGLISKWNPNRASTFFMYGGAWMAEYESPKGLIANGMFGKSTNQQMVNGPEGLALEVDDFIFLRPSQSEAVFLQFGAIQTVRNRQLGPKWPVFSERS